MWRAFIFPGLICGVVLAGSCTGGPEKGNADSHRDRISINEEWRFFRYDSPSYGNEVGEQYTGEEGAALAEKLEGIVSPMYPAFHEAFPGKVIVNSETASTLSSRGTYLFTVLEGISAPVSHGQGGDPEHQYVSAYELYTTPFGSSPDKVFDSQDRNPCVAGEFVWTGWDYLGEPRPYYSARSSYFGIIDLAGFKKDRYYLYQSRWRPELPMAHILPHWNWPERTGMITPVHVFTSGDEAELFLNGESLGRRVKTPCEYRLRWDSVVYEPGELKVVAYRDGETWAEEVVRTTSEAAMLEAAADREIPRADGKDLAFVTVRVTDQEGYTVPRSDHLIAFAVEGPGEIVATDNGDPAGMVPFPSPERKAFSGLALAIVRSHAGEGGTITLRATSGGLEGTSVKINSR
jgi:beta-galactosidase